MTQRPAPRTAPPAASRKAAPAPAAAGTSAAPAAGTSAAPAAGTSSTAPAPGAFLTLFSVQFQHGYYNASGGKCPDFKVVPSPSCSSLMATLGMLFKDQGDGFSVFIPQSRVAAMMSWVAGNFCPGEAGYGYWTRLTFFLVLKNPQFIGITALPINTNPTQQNFYASNLQTTQQQSGLLFGAGGGLGQDALYSVTGPTVSVAATAACTVTASDISGATVASVAASGAGTVAVSLSGAANGLYTIAADPAGAAATPGPLLFVPPAPPISGIIDLLLTQPVAGLGDTAAFPVPPLPAPPTTALPAATPQAVQLILPFDARATYLNYYVVSQGRRSHFSDDLSISGKGTTFLQSNVVLPSGDQAVLFSARTPLPLAQHASHRFSLSGQRRGLDGGRNDVQVKALPSAPSAPVWPAASGESLSGRSEIYVYV